MSFVVIFALWLVLNGRVTLEIVLLGLAISLGIAIFCRKLIPPGDPPAKKPLRRYGYLLEYILLLLWEIVKAAAAVLGIAASKRLEFQPALVYFRTELNTEFARVMLANSITLTPGTITASLEDGVYCVHCLDKSMADGIETSSFVKILRRIEEA